MVLLIHQRMVHHKVLSSYLNGNGNKVHSFLWNKHNILTVRSLNSIRNLELKLIFDFIIILVASLLSCLHQLKIENSRLEDHINSLVSRRDHLLAVNARLAIPLGQPSSAGQGKITWKSIEIPTGSLMLETHFSYTFK